MFSWHPALQTDQDNLMWCYLRAVEWKSWPAFVSQPIVPILFIFFPWYIILLSIVLLSWLWAAIRHNFVSPSLAELGLFFVKLKWITIPVAAIYLAYTGHYVLAIISLFWTFLAAIVGFVPGGLTGKIQKMFMACFGYEYQNPMDQI
jgi:hypothetical protein